MKPTDSEYDPSDLDLSAARNNLANLEHQLHAIDQALSHAQAAEDLHLIKGLRVERSRLITSVEYQWAILAPIRRVLPEILGEIFFYFLTPWNPLDEIRPWSGFDYAPWLLTRICRRWRRIAFGTPQLWKVIHMAYPMNLPLIIPLWVRSSGALPFDVFLEFPALFPQVQHPTFLTVLQAIWDQFNRCNTFFVELSPADFARFGEFLNSGRQCLMPALKTLVVHSDQIKRIGQLYAPNLRNLIIQTKQWRTIDLEPIRHALPLPLPYLTTLYLEKISTTVDDVLNLIHASNDLTHCTLMFDYLNSSASISSDLPILFPKLQSLTLDWFHSDAAITSFLCALHVPALTTLTLHGRTPFGSVVDFRQMLDFGKWGEMGRLERLNLRKLSVADVQDEALVQFMKPHQGIREIDVIGTSGLAQFVQSLVPVGLFPVLTKFSMSLEGEVVFPILRAIRPRVDGNLKEFVLMSKAGISPERQELLREWFPIETDVQAHVISYRRSPD